MPAAPFLAPPEDHGRVCHTVAEARAAVEAVTGPVVLKAPFSTAGRDRRRSWDEPWVTRTLARQGAVVVEPWLDRVADLSFQYRGGRLEGWGRFFTDGRGTYRGTWLGSPWAGLPEVNPRRTLGRIALALGRQVSQASPPASISSRGTRWPPGPSLGSGGSSPTGWWS